MILVMQSLLKQLFICLFGVVRRTQEFFTHMETSPLPVNGLKR